MASPHIINRRPLPEATGMLIGDYFRFGVRDAATRIDISSLYVQTSYGKDLYEGSALPSEEDLDTFLAAFSDAGPTSVLSINKAARSIVGGKLVLTRDTASAHRGAQVLRAPSLHSPFMLEAAVSPIGYTLGATPYLNDIRYVGTAFGLVDGPRKLGAFVFLLKDGPVYKLILSGPDDGTGTRPVSLTITYDWTVPSIFLLVWDPTAPLNRVSLYVRAAAAPNQDATLLGSISLAAMSPFVNGVALGGVPLGPTDDDVDDIMGLVSMDSPTIGDSSSVDYLRVYRYGRNLILGGIAWNDTDAIISPSDRMVADLDVLPGNALLPWFPTLTTGSLELSEGELTISKVLGVDNGEQLSYLYREEPSLDLSEGLWVEATIRAEDVTHALTVGTGMGLAFDDGVSQVKLMLLDDFADLRVGVQQTGAKTQLSAYAYGGAVDWEEDLTIKLFVSGADDVVEVLIGSEDTAYASGQYTALPASALLGVRWGHVDTYSLRPVFGDVTLTGLRYSLNSQLYLPSMGLPTATATPWTAEVLGAGSQVIAADLLVLMDLGYGDPSGPAQSHRYFRKAIPYMGSTIGVSSEVRFKIDGWSNELGAVGELNTPISCGLVIDDGADAARMMFVQTPAGAFVYIPTSNLAQSLADVIAQNEDGEAISAELDSIYGLHTYRLEKRPYNHVRLYVDGQLVIDVPWDTSYGFDLPSPVLAAPGLGWGSFDSYRQTLTTWRRVVYSAGDGYDVAVKPALVENERVQLFDSRAGLTLTVEGL